MLGALLLLSHYFLASTHATGCSSANNGYNPQDKLGQDTILPLTYEWQKFYFTNTNSAGFPKFTDLLVTNCQVQVVDLYCPGDILSIVIGSEFVSPTILPNNITCDISSSDPTVAMANGEWGKTCGPFQAVTNGSIVYAVVESSPFTAGAGAIRCKPLS